MNVKFSNFKSLNFFYLSIKYLNNICHIPRKANVLTFSVGENDNGQ